MNRTDWSEICAYVAAAWPHAPWPDATAALFYTDLQDHPADQILAAVKVMARDGREFPPTAGMIHKRLAELATDAPDWAVVWHQIRRLVMAGLGGPYEGLRRRADHLLATDTHPLVAEFVNHAGHTEVYDNFQEGGGGEARLREKWRAFVDRSTRDRAYVGINPAGLPSLERTTTPSGPRRMEAGLKLITDRAAGPEGDAA